MAKFTVQQLHQVINILPSITSNGLQPEKMQSPLPQDRRQFAAWQAALYSEETLVRVQRALVLLEELHPTHTYNRLTENNSNALRILAENWYSYRQCEHACDSYIGNPAFIIAAVAAGFSVVQSAPTNPSAFLNVSTAELQRVRDILERGKQQARRRAA